MRLPPSVRRALAAPAVLLALASPLAAQPLAQPSRGDTTLRIILLTMGPGDEVWEKFGHNAIWVHDPAAGTDQAYNYGMFDFRQKNFVLNFARGRMNYWMEGFDAYLTLDHYRMLNRSVWAQELNLTPAQARQVRDFLEWNARPENRFYRYDYYRDNCSTRVRDVLDRVLGGALGRATKSAPAPAGVTYRWHTRRLVGQGAGNIPIYTAIDGGLGPAADRPLSRWEEMFLPMKLRDEVRALKVPGPGGEMVPLVAREQTVFTATRPPEPAGPPHWLLGYLLAGVVIGGLIALFAAMVPRHWSARAAFSAVSGMWVLVAGVGGLVLLGLWLLTDHVIAYRNLNLLQLSPFALPLVVCLPALAYGKRWAPRWAVRLSLLVAAMSVLGMLLKVLPWFRQVNGEMIALALPINLAIAWSAWRLAGAPRIIAPARTPVSALVRGRWAQIRFRRRALFGSPGPATSRVPRRGRRDGCAARGG